MSSAADTAGRLGGLKARVLRASGWSVLGQLGQQVLRLAGSLILTRLLVPELFGVMSLAVMFVVAIGMFSDVGLGQVVVRHPTADDPSFLNTIWTTQIMRGGLIAGCGSIIAFSLMGMRHLGWLPADSAYAHPDLPIALFGISCASIINGFESTRLLTALRSLQMNKLAFTELVAQACGLAATVGWALVSPTIFAVTGGAIANALARMVMSHLYFDGIRNRLHWSKQEFMEVLNFGRWVFLSSILGFLIGNGDKMLLGAFLDARLFGIYSIGAMIAGVVADVFGRIVNLVIYPALNESYRNDPSRLKATYYKARTPVDAACCIAAGIMLVAGPSMIHLLYDNRYAEAGPVVQILSLSMLFLGLNSSENLYMIIGKPWVVTLLTFIRLTTVYAAMPLLAWRYGLLGGAAGMVLSQALKAPAMYWMKHRFGYLSVRRELLIIPFLGVGVVLGWIAKFPLDALASLLRHS